MKNIQEIIARSVILLCVSDRCALEKSTISGVRYSLEQKDEQRLAIYQWLQRQEYVNFMTCNEKRLFEQEVDSGDKEKVLSYQIQYEAIEPCLWTLGLIQSLSNYNQFVVQDFHPVLQIGMNHKLDQILAICKLKTEKDIELQKEIAMLWNWRAIECNNPVFNTKSIKEIIKLNFGSQYEVVLDKVQQFSNQQNDFIVDNKPVSKLSLEEQKRLKSIAKWRQHAFEWIIGNMAWDETETNT